MFTLWKWHTFLKKWELSFADIFFLPGSKCACVVLSVSMKFSKKNMIGINTGKDSKPFFSWWAELEVDLSLCRSKFRLNFLWGCLWKLLNECYPTSQNVMFFKNTAEKKELSGFQSPLIIIGIYVPPPQQMTGVALMSQFFFLLTVWIVIKWLIYLPFGNIFIFKVL